MENSKYVEAVLNVIGKKYNLVNLKLVADEWCINIKDKYGVTINSFIVSNNSSEISNLINKLEGWLSGWIDSENYYMNKSHSQSKPIIENTNYSSTKKRKKNVLYFKIHEDNIKKFREFQISAFGYNKGSMKKAFSYIVQYIREHPEAQSAKLSKDELKSRYIKGIQVTSTEDDLQFLNRLQDMNGSLTFAIRDVYNQEIVQQH